MYPHKILLFQLLLVSTAANSKAFCALRDPVAQIYQLFPQADAYRFFVRTVDDDVRQLVEQKIPYQELHLDELGKHTLYVALKDGEPLGVVHVRSEQSQWGLIEIAWAINLDLTIRNFNFQRSRAVGNQIILQNSFKQLIINKDFSKLSAYIDTTGRINDDELHQAAKQVLDLAKVVVINGLKTLLVTQIAWATELNELRANASI